MSPERSPGPQEGQLLQPPCFERADTDLVVLARRGDTAAASRLLQRHLPRLARLVASVLGGDRDRHDVLQDVLEHVARGLPTLRDPTLFVPWTRSIALGRVRKHLRARRRRQWLVFWEDTPPAEPEAPVASDDVRQAVRALYRLLDQCPAQERIAFCLRHVEGLKLEEVAATTGTSLATCKRRLARAERLVKEAGADHPDLARFAAGGER